jgi:DNA polymerase-1
LPEHLQKLDPEIYLSNNYVVLDFETNIQDKGNPVLPDNHIVCACWTIVRGDLVRTKYLYGNEYDLQDLLHDISEADFTVAHNTKFEIGWLQRAGLDTQNHLFYCTMLGEHVRRGNRIQMRISLDECLKRYKLAQKFDVVKKFWEAGVDTADIPEFIVREYVIQDVSQTHELFIKQRELLYNRNQLSVAFTRNILTPALVDAEFNGMCLDSDAVIKEYSDRQKELTKLRNEMSVMTGGINHRSPKQVGAFLYEELGFKPPKVRGEVKYKTDKATLANLKPRNKRQREFLKLKAKLAAAESAMSKTIAPLYKCVTDAKEQGHAPIMNFKFSQITAQTHRLSSKGMEYGAQGQNIPREFKKLFTSRSPDYKVGEGDGAQLEFRTGAFLGQDSQAMADIANGEDIHSYTAAVIFGKSRFQMAIEEAFNYIKANKKHVPECKAARQDAKPFTFRPLYGGGDNDETNGYCEAFRSKYHEMTAEQQRWKEEVLNRGKLVLPWDMIFYWPDTKLTSDGYITNSTKICNYPVQSLATAEIIPIAVAYFWTYLKNGRYNSFLTNTIHDSAITETHIDEIDEVTMLYEQAFVGDVYNYLKVVYNIDFNVPLECEVEFFNNWSVKDEVA